MRMTDLERKMLTAIGASEYNSDPDQPDVEVWAWSVGEDFGKSAGGIMSSLSKKGWAYSCSSPDGDTIAITQDGLDALKIQNEIETEFQITQLPHLGPMVITNVGEENMYFTLVNDGRKGFCKVDA